MKKVLLLTISILIVLNIGFSQNSMNRNAQILPQVTGSMIKGLKDNFSAKLKGTAVSEVFEIIAKQSGLNIIVSPKITATITGNFKNVPLGNVFRSILSANNLYYVEDEMIIKILTFAEYKQELIRNFMVTKAYDASITGKNSGFKISVFTFYRFSKAFRVSDIYYSPYYRSYSVQHEG